MVKELFTQTYKELFELKAASTKASDKLQMPGFLGESFIRKSGKKMKRISRKFSSIVLKVKINGNANTKGNYAYNQNNISRLQKHAYTFPKTCLRFPKNDLMFSQ